MDSTPSPTPEVDRALLIRAALGLVGVVALAALCGLLLREPITAAAAWFIGAFGLGGVFAGVVFTDASPLPLTHEPILLLAVAMDVELWRVGTVAATASVSAGPVGYLGGTLLRRQTSAQGWLEARAPGMVGFLRRWGASGVAVAALLPIPFATATWTAGLVAVPFWKVAAASLLRIPKTLFYLALVAWGWGLGG